MVWPTPHWPTADQIYARLGELADDARYSSFCTKQDLPEASRQGRRSRYLRIAAGTATNRTTCLITAGIHAREWAPPTAVVNFVGKLLNAYATSSAITIRHGTSPGYVVSHSTVKNICERLELYVAPMINPEGYDFSRANGGDPLRQDWRKNRAPAPAVIPPQCVGAGSAAVDLNIGVDLNRNFDVVWDFNRFYSTTAGVQTSTDCCEEIFCGAAAWSEPESRNVRALLDLGARYYADVHAFGPTVLHSWGIETNGTDPNKNFRNPAFDRHPPPGFPGRDGSTGSAYAEYMEPTVLTEITTIAATMETATNRATRTPYPPQPGALLATISGAADDYAFSRHIADPTKPRTFAYTIECGSAAENRFFPDYNTQFPKIDKEVQAALFALLAYPSNWTPPPTPTPSGCGRICFIATTVYGSADHADVTFLRVFRDRDLPATTMGRSCALVITRLYDRAGPRLASAVAVRPRLRSALRHGLTGFVSVLRHLMALGPGATRPVARSVWAMGVLGGLSAAVLVGAACLAALVLVLAELRDP